MRQIPLAAATLLSLSFSLAGCGGGQKASTPMEIRPLEESKAFSIVEEMLKDRGFLGARDVEVVLTNDVRFSCDFRVTGHKIAIEYLTAQDRFEMGEIPPPATGSKLHVLAARVASDTPGVPGEPLYVYFIDEKKYQYQVNPSSENRADVTFFEVDSRLRRDLADFLTWYQSSEFYVE